MLRRLVSASLLAGGALLSCMCSEPDHASEFCNSKCLCLGTCTDADRETCITEWNANHDEAIAEKCEEPFSAWTECITSGTGCVSTDYDAGCLDSKDAWQLCVTG